MSIKERLQMVMKMNNLTNAGFADRVGVQRSSISHVMAGRNKPSLDFIQKTLVAFPRVNAQWLITGKQQGQSPEVSYQEDNEIKPDPGHEEEPEKKPVSAQETHTKEIERIVVFYTDGTFTDTYPKSTKQ